MPAAAILVVLLGTVPATAAPVDTLATIDATVGSTEGREDFLLGADRRPLLLARGAIVAGSFVLRVGGETWREGRDYRLRSRTGVVVPLRPWTGAGRTAAVATYRFRPGLLAPRIGWRPMTPAPPRRTAAGAGDDAAGAEPEWDLEAMGDLQVRGSKSVYVSSGTNRELTVDQNLRLNVSGRLTRDILVRAQLTDDNLPVVPEGNTEELQDIDKVLVELEAPTWSATLGDFVARRQGTRFGEYRRKLQGFAATTRPGRAEVGALFGSPRGRYRTLEIRGEEANQGPYSLSASGAGGNLFVVAGSERVTLDGERLTRGQDNDYIIDYVRGTITFTYRRLVTADSIIVVEYEEGEGAYARSVVGGGGGGRWQLGSVPVHLDARILRERDDPGRLRSGELDEEDEAALAAAGDDPLAAVAPGAVQVEPGTGDYVRVGTGDGAYFEYAEDGGDWSLQFFHAGAAGGDYDLESLTETGVRVYTYVGAGQGSYRLGRQLPLPSSQSLVTLAGAVGDTAGASLHAEWHLSRADGNVLSARDDADNDGQAGRVVVRSGSRHLAGGELELAGFIEQRDDRFRGFTVTKTLHEFEGWGLGERARRAGFLGQRDRELRGSFGWRTGGTGRRLEITGDAGRLEHGADLAASRYTMQGGWEWRGGRGRHRWREAASRDTVDPLDILRREQEHDVAWRVGAVVPRATYRFRSWADDAATTPAGRGYRLEELSGGLGSRPGAAWNWEVRFTHGIADSLRGDRWAHVRDSRTWRTSAATPRVAGMRLVADATVREVQLPGDQEEATRLARLELTGSWARLGSDWSLSYGLDNSRTEVLARQVVFVGVGEGRYDEAGDFVGEGRGDYDVLLAGTDSLVATTAVRADLSWRQDMTAFGKSTPWTAWSSQTQIGVEARNRGDEIGRLLTLDPAVVFDEETAVLGRVDLSQELALLRNLRAWDLRWRFAYRQTRDRQYAQGREDRLDRGHLLSLTFNPLATVSLRLRGERDAERRDTDAELTATLRSYDALAERLEFEGAWRPVAGTRAALALERLWRRDAASGVRQREWALKPSLRWQVREHWSLQAQWRLSEVASDEPAGAQRPYFFAFPGTNADASSRLSWEPNRYLSFALAWFGRKPGGQEWQHDLRLESTARF